jgi:hypothetical protein
MGTATHARSPERARTGSFSHKAWSWAENPTPSPYSGDNNHRAYPTVQLSQLPEGSFETPCLIELWVWLDVPSARPGEWFSFATFSADASPAWNRVVLLNLSQKGYVHLMHVPEDGQSAWDYQNKALKFPMRQWVQLKVYLDFDPVNGYAKAWMNGTLVSAARVEGGGGYLAQAHFGLYTPPTLGRATVFNDDLAIYEGVPTQAPVSVAARR